MRRVIDATGPQGGGSDGHELPAELRIHWRMSGDSQAVPHKSGGHIYPEDLAYDKSVRITVASLYRHIE